MQTLRERILSAAYPLFVEHGYNGVSETNIQDAAGVTAQELTAAFPSKEALATACVVHRNRDWVIAVTEAAARKRGTDPESRLIAVFDIVEESYQSEDDDAAPFLEVLIDLGRDNRLGRPDTAHLSKVREAIARLASDAGLLEPEAFALEFHVLLKASILSALEGDTLTGIRAREMGRELIYRHRARDLAREAAAVPAGTYFGDASFDLYDVGTTPPVPGNSLIDWYDDPEYGETA